MNMCTYACIYVKSACAYGWMGATQPFVSAVTPMPRSFDCHLLVDRAMTSAGLPTRGSDIRLQKDLYLGSDK